MTLQATNALTDVLLTRALTDADAGSPHRQPDRIAPDDASADAAARAPSAAGGAFDIGGLEIVRKFVEHLVAERAGEASENGSSARWAVDWESLAGSVGESPCLEAAVGRAVVVVDRLIREPSCDVEELEAWTASTMEDPFFAFSMADVVPDFGPERYRSRVARKVARMIRKRQATPGLD